MKRLKCRQRLGSSMRDPPHHGIDQPCVASMPRIFLDQPHGQIDRRMSGSVEKQELRSADQERVFHLRAALWQAPVQNVADHAAQCSESPQRGGDDATRQGPVACAELLQARIGVSVVQLLVKRPVTTQHSVEQIGRRPPREKARRMTRVRLREGARHFQTRVSRSAIRTARIFIPLNLQIPGKTGTCDTFSATRFDALRLGMMNLAARAQAPRVIGFSETLNSSLDVPGRIRILVAVSERFPLNAGSGSADGESAPVEGLKGDLVPAAKRAIAEAQARRTEIDRKSKEQPKELHGRKGLDPVRYGDWEVKGIASDF